MKEGGVLLAVKHSLSSSLRASERAKKPRVSAPDALTGQPEADCQRPGRTSSSAYPPSFPPAEPVRIANSRFFWRGGEREIYIPCFLGCFLANVAGPKPGIPPPPFKHVASFTQRGGGETLNNRPPHRTFPAPALEFWSIETNARKSRKPRRVWRPEKLCVDSELKGGAFPDLVG